LWEVANGTAFRERRGDGPRGVPTVEGDRLYAYSADGTLACLDTKTGKRVWSYNAVERFKGAVPNWGISESPLIDGERLIVVTGGQGASVVALNKRTGEPVWRSQSDPAAYSSAILAESTPRQVLTFTANGAVGLRADNGELLWRYDQVANRTANIATPIYHNGHAFYSSDYGTGCVLLRLQPQGGSVKATEVYFNRDMKNHYSSSVLVGDHLYGYSSIILTAMKFLTGEVAWQSRSVGKGSVIYAEGHLYLVGEDGTIGLAEATPEAYKEKSRFTIAKSSRPMWAPPVIANGHLFIRDQDTLYIYDIRAKR
jgi:outer membrane protein assembly factor BamB